VEVSQDVANSATISCSAEESRNDGSIKQPPDNPAFARFTSALTITHHPLTGSLAIPITGGLR